jgi:hypothetical protein
LLDGLRSGFHRSNCGVISVGRRGRCWRRRGSAMR